MEWAAEGGHEEVVRLYRELRASKFDSPISWAASSGHENIMQLFRDWGLPISSHPLSGQQTMVVKIQCDYVMSGEPPTSTRLWYGPRVVVTNPLFICATIGVPKKSTWLWHLLPKKVVNLSCNYVVIWGLPPSNRLCCVLQAWSRIYSTFVLWLGCWRSRYCHG